MLTVAILLVSLLLFPVPATTSSVIQSTAIATPITIQSTTITVSEDSQVDSNNPNLNHGSWTTMRAGVYSDGEIDRT